MSGMEMIAERGTAGAEQPPFSPMPQRSPSVDVERRPDGCILIRSAHAPGAAPQSIAHLFAERAAEHPDRPLLLRREPGHGPWRGVTYGEAKRAADGIAQWLLGAGLDQESSVMVLSENSVEHGLMMLGCYAAGVPIVPVSPAYSLMSTDFAKLRHCFALTRPAVVFAQSGVVFARAIAALREMDPSLTLVTADGSGDDAVPFADVRSTEPTIAVDQARDAVGAATVAKYLFTSGSTGMPKAVPQTHGMMTAMLAGQEGLRDPAAPRRAPPASLEWMPWSHVSAGNIFFNGNLWDGGTIHIDEGRPLPGMFETTVRNLHEVSPTVFGSAPVAFAMLAAAMEDDPALRASFFRNLVYMGYGGATLSDDVYRRMQALAIAETGRRVPLVTMYGATETQGVTSVHWATDRVGLVGLPSPGSTLKLVPVGEKLEVRVKGPTVMAGYLRDEERTASAFDEEGFYRLGDAARFLDPDRPEDGLVFDGRVTEDFKLATGTWVSVGTLRPDVVAACSPYVFDAVLAGQDRPFLAALLWPAPAAAAELARSHGTDAPAELARILAERLAAFNAASGGSSRRIRRFSMLSKPPYIDSGEITDKGYVNQRAVLERRADVVAALYADEPGPTVIDVPSAR